MLKFGSDRRGGGVEARREGACWRGSYPPGEEGQRPKITTATTVMTIRAMRYFMGVTTANSE